MRQQEVSDHIARRIDARMAGAVVLVGLDEALLDLDVELLQAETLGDALPPARDQKPFTFQGLRLLPNLGVYLDRAVGALQTVRLHLGSGKHLDPPLGEIPSQQLPYLLPFLG